MRPVFEDKLTRAGRIVFARSEVYVTNHALDRWMQRGGTEYSSRLDAFEALASEFADARPVRTFTNPSGRPVIDWETSRWVFVMSPKRRRLVTCYRRRR